MKNWIIGLLAIGLMGAGIVMVGCGQSTDTTTTTTTTTTLYSISGKVNFASTSDGIKGGVDISVSDSSTVVATTSADVNTGTYEVSGLSAGSYTLSTSKEGWTISDIVATIESASLTNEAFTADPTDWDVSFISGNPDLYKVSSGEVYGVPTIAIIGAGSGGLDLCYTSTDGGGSWNSVQATSDATVRFLDVSLHTTQHIYIFDNKGYARGSTNEVDWTVTGPMVLEAPNVYLQDYAGTSPQTQEAVGMNGKLYRTDDSAANFYEAGDGVTGFKGVAAWPYSGDIYMVAVGESGKIRYYDGSSWNNQDCPGPIVFQDVSFGDSLAGGQRYVTMAGYATTDSQGVIMGIWPESTSGGNEILTGVPYKLNGIWSTLDANDTNHSGVIVVGDNGVVLIGK